MITKKVGIQLGATTAPSDIPAVAREAERLGYGEIWMAEDYFQIRIVDEATGRGVPLVEVTTVNGIRQWTDSAGIVAFHEPGLMNREYMPSV